MIDLYSWFCPNGHKVHIMLEETGLIYEVKPVSIAAGEQFDASFVALNPNSKVPVIVDHDGPAGRPVTIFETGAILLYLAEKTGQFVPSDPALRWQVVQWLMWQMGGLGPMMGQAQHFVYHTQTGEAYATDRYVSETARLLRVLDQRLATRDFICDAYSIADIACFPWVRIHKLCGQDIAVFPNVGRWYGEIRNRPAVGRALDILKDRYVDIATSDEAKTQLFGQARQPGKG
ncbi:MAG: glutathione S-transferase family protein [Hyphomicrobiaceae bacterium]